MKRKIIAQGLGGRTVFLPIKWIRENNLEPGDEVEILSQEENLIIKNFNTKKLKKITTLQVENLTLYTLRSLIGSFYRSGYDEIKIIYKDQKVLKELQKTVEMLFGFEILDITKNSCTIKAVFQESNEELKQHLLKMIHTVKTMQSILSNDLQEIFNSSEEMQQFRINLLKQRDLISRSIIKQRLFDQKQFPFYLLSYNVWQIGRSYNHLYTILKGNKKTSTNNIQYLNKVNAFFGKVLDNLQHEKLVDNHNTYENLLKEGKTILNKKQDQIIVSFCLNILGFIQSSNSLIMVINC